MGSDSIERPTGPADLARPHYWVLVAVDRWIVAAGFAIVLFVSITAVGAVDAVPFRTLVEQGHVTRRLFQALILNLITAVTLVVTINQIVLSQEVAAPSEQRDRLQEALNFRGDVAERIDAPVAPTEPSAFFVAILDTIADRAAELREISPEATSDAFRQAVEELADQLTGRAEERIEAVEGAEWGTFGVLDAVLRFDNSSALYHARRLEGRFSDEFSPDVAAVHAALVDALSHFALGREYFKSLFIQRELIALSRAMIYTALPGLIAVTLGLLFLDRMSFPGTTAGIDHLVVLVAVVTTLAVYPFLLLLAYVLRLGTISKFNLAVGPFEVD